MCLKKSRKFCSSHFFNFFSFFGGEKIIYFFNILVTTGTTVITFTNIWSGLVWSGLVWSGLVGNLGSTEWEFPFHFPCPVDSPGRPCRE